jgi:hypothetical protein
MLEQIPFHTDLTPYDIVTNQYCRYDFELLLCVLDDRSLLDLLTMRFGGIPKMNLYYSCLENFFKYKEILVKKNRNFINNYS